MRLYIVHEAMPDAVKPFEQEGLVWLQLDILDPSTPLAISAELKGRSVDVVLR